MAARGSDVYQPPVWDVLDYKLSSDLHLPPVRLPSHRLALVLAARARRQINARIWIAEQLGTQIAEQPENGAEDMGHVGDEDADTEIKNEDEDEDTDDVAGIY